MRVVLQVQDEIRRALAGAIAAAAAAGELSGDVPEFVLEVPRQKEHGDFATNAALLMAKTERKPPRQVAEAIVRHLGTEGGAISGADVAGPGFINFRLRPGWLHQALVAIQQEGEGFARSDHGQGKRILLEYVSANPTGPLVIVNARAATIGSTLARLLNTAGYVCHTEFYVNDGGNQVRILAATLDFRCREILNDDSVVQPPEIYPGEYNVEAARVWLELHGITTVEAYNAYKAAAPATASAPPGEAGFMDALARWGTEYFRSGQQGVLDRFGVSFDQWFSERTLRDEQWPEKVVQHLRDLGQVYEAEGASWLKTSEFGDDKDRVIVKSDGGFTYVVPDIAYHWNKFRRGYSTLIDILGQDHHGYVPRLRASLRCLGYPGEAVEVLLIQMVRVIRGGQLVRMSKRKGDFVLMADLLDEVSVDAARFFFLMRSCDTQMDFDLDLANLKSNENPVFYVQYAHARIASLLREADKRGHSVPDAGQVDLTVLTDESELALTRKLADLPEEVIGAADAREAQRLTRYVHEVATAFHSFYTRCRVITDDAGLTAARLVLTDATRSVLRSALSLMGVSAPDSM